MIDDEHQDTNTSDNKTGEMKTAEKTKTIRTNMAIVHFLFNWPKWSLSLYIFLATRSVRLQTPQDGIEIPLRRLQTAVHAEAQSYQSCAIDAFKDREKELREISQQELQRVSQLQAKNQDLINEVQEDVDVCLQSTERARNVLVEWIDKNKDVLPRSMATDDETLCGEQEREKFWSIIGGETRTVQNELSSVLNEFISGTKRSLALVGTYTKDRFGYDFEYFVANRIQPAMDLLGTQNLTNAIFFSIDSEALQDEMGQNFEQLKNMLNHASEQMQGMNDRIDLLSSTLEEFHSAYMTLYNRLVEGARFVQDILPPGAPLPDFLDVSVLPVADSFLPNLDSNIGGELNSIEAVLENSTQACLDVLDATIQSLTQQSNLQLRASYDDLSNSLKSILDFKDYDPPVFQGSTVDVKSISEEIQLLNQRSQGVAEMAMLSLEKLKFADDIKNITDFEEDINRPDDFVLADDRSAFAYLQARLPSLSFPGLLIILVSWVYTNAWVLEVLVQAVRFWRLETIYSKGAIPHLPEIAYGNGDKHADGPLAMVLFFKALRAYVATPRNLLLILMSPLFILTAMAWKPHIHNSCEVPGEGTFLATEFLAPLLINEASMPGNAVFLKEEFQCHQSRRKMCKQMENELNPRHQIDLESIRELRQLKEETRRMLELLGDCIDENVIVQINGSCCGLKGYTTDCVKLQNTSSVCPIDYSVWPAAPFPRLTELLSQTPCIPTQNMNLTTALFDCAAMTEACNDIPCAGINTELLTSEIIKADCKVEQYLIDCCMFFFVALYHAVAINIICSLFLNGVRQVLWRQLCISGLKFHTRVFEDGSLARGQEKEDRAKRVSRAIQKLKALGVFQLIIGALVMLLWALSIPALAS